MALTDESKPRIVEWRRLSPDEIAPPIVETVSSLELKLEHPDLEATGRREQFFPDAVPYELDGERRAFYWRPALAAGATDAEPSAWRLACATTHGLAGIAELPAVPPALASEEEGEEGEIVHAVVGGTVAGDATTVRLSDVDLLRVRIEGVSSDSAELAVAGRSVTVAAGLRRTLDLEPRRVTLADRDVETTTEPTLSVRFPGERTLHHPAPGASYRYFPSFGLDLDRVASPLAVPTTVGELDHETLAEQLGVDLSARPYPERVLWQAFAHAAFDPNAAGDAGICQLDSGRLVVEPTAGSYADRTASSSSS